MGDAIWIWMCLAQGPRTYERPNVNTSSQFPERLQHLRKNTCREAIGVSSFPKDHPILFIGILSLINFASKFIRKTISLCQQLEKCGATFLTVHGRTPSQKIGQPSDNELLRQIKQSISIPLIANGDCKSLQDADDMFETIGCDGVMAARAILTNPTLFSGKYETTPIECVQEWLNIGAAAGENIAFQFFHHHFTFMMEKMLRKRQRAVFNSFTRRQPMYDYLDEMFDLRPQPIDVPENITCVYDETNYRNRMNELNIEKTRRSKNQYSSENTPGKFFLEKVNDDLDTSDCDDAEFPTNLFDID